MGSKGRTELQISRSRAKNVEEAAGDIRFCVFPPKTGENTEKLICSSKIFEMFRKCPNASERIQMHPDASERIRTHPNASEQVRTGPNRSKQVRKLQKTGENLETKIFANACFFFFRFIDRTTERPNDYC